MGRQQGLEAAPLLGGGEAVEDDGVLAHVGVHVQGHVGPGLAQRRRAAVRATRRRGSRRRCTSTSTSPSAVPRRSSSPSQPPDHASASRSGGGDGPAQGLRRCRWQTARARASATSGGLGRAGELQQRGHHGLHLLLGGAAEADDGLLDLVRRVLGHLAAAPRPPPPGRARRPGPWPWRCARWSGRRPARPPRRRAATRPPGPAARVNRREAAARAAGVSGRSSITPPAHGREVGCPRRAGPAHSRTATGRGRCPGRTRVRL